MSDTLQLVVTCNRFKLREIDQPDVRYASACRDLAQIQLLSEMRAVAIDDPIICKLSLKEVESIGGHHKLKRIGHQFLKEVECCARHDKLKRIGHQFLKEVECCARHDKLKRIGHQFLKEVECCARHDKLKHIGHLQAYRTSDQRLPPSAFGVRRFLAGFGFAISNLSVTPRSVNAETVVSNGSPCALIWNLKLL
jgi:hypothetical protein